jgi:hypothetical protein
MSGTLMQAPPFIWREDLNVRYPASELAGGKVCIGCEVWICYDRTPEGAVFAAAAAAGYFCSMNMRGTWVNNCMLPGSAQDYLRDEGDYELNGYETKVIAFRLDEYSGDRAKVNIVVEAKGYHDDGPSVYHLRTFILIWTEGVCSDIDGAIGDWQADMALVDAKNTQKIIENLDGFHEFK